MAFFDDMKAAVEAYPVTDVDLQIVDVSVPDNVLNVGEEGLFKVKVTNRGPLNMTGVTLRIYGLNNVVVADAGARRTLVERVRQRLRYSHDRWAWRFANHRTGRIPFQSTHPRAAIAADSQGIARGMGCESRPYPHRAQRSGCERQRHV